MDAARSAERAGGAVPVYLMTSFATHADVERLSAPLSTARCPIRSRGYQKRHGETCCNLRPRCSRD